MPESLTKKSAVGVAWLLVQTGGSKIIGFVSQMVLARLLRPTDFGDVALATAVSAVLAVLVGFGIDDVLLSRAKRLRMWGAPAVTISLLLSILGSLAMFGFAPIASSLYHNHNISKLLFISAISLPLGAPSAVPNASLRHDMRFRFLATYSTVELFAVQIITISLAWWGFGAESFVIPLPLAAAAKTFIFWNAAELRIRWRIRPSQLKTLLSHGAAVFGQKLVITVRNNGDYMMLGAFAANSTVGLYFMAFKIAAMPVYAFANSLTGVLYPALTKLRGDAERQYQAAINASRLIAMVVIPLSFLQAALAGEIIHICFGIKWSGAAPMLRILSIGLAFDVVPCVAWALMSANGKFKMLYRWAIWSLPLFFLLIGTGCAAYGALGVAFGVCAFFILMAPTYSFLAFKSYGCTFRDIAMIYLPPTFYSVVAVFLADMVIRIPVVANRDLLTISLASIVSVVTYSGLVGILSPWAAREAVQKFTMMVGKPA